MMSNDQRARPSYRAFQLAAEMMVNIESASREVRGEDAVITTLNRADGARIIVAWTKTGAGAGNLEIEARYPAALLFDWTGESRVIRGDANGNYILNLPVAPGRNLAGDDRYSVGGPTFMIMEFDNEAPSSAIQMEALPGGRSIVLSWEANDGALGTGAESYEIQVSRDNGPWEALDPELIDGTEAIVDISSGGAFAFRVRATDFAGNQGGYSIPVSTQYTPSGFLAIQVLDIRNQPVPFARLTLADGSLHDADEEGWIRIQHTEGTVQLINLDGSLHGQRALDASYSIARDQQTVDRFMLLPLENLINNGAFSDGLNGWNTSPDGSLVLIDHRIERGVAARLTGVRRPWGYPYLSVQQDIPTHYNSAILSFEYHLPAPESNAIGQWFQVRAITPAGQTTLFQTQEPTDSFTRHWVDLSSLAGQPVQFIFEIVGPRGAAPISVEIDTVILGNVPILD
ncbi:MAG: hypothetical protein GYB68_15830 [Chloroflexi bacterium]|nr:hypothetical protein [Chloroflexota bacterium]